MTVSQNAQRNGDYLAGVAEGPEAVAESEAARTRPPTTPSARLSATIRQSASLMPPVSPTARSAMVRATDLACRSITTTVARSAHRAHLASRGPFFLHAMPGAASLPGDVQLISREPAVDWLGPCFWLVPGRWVRAYCLLTSHNVQLDNCPHSAQRRRDRDGDVNIHNLTMKKP